ncbi:MAG: adenylosuccinate synthase [Caldilineaceae bacterium]|nr:adenylosuccinate synthase [Caldilineaceae bacterium]
MPATAIVGAQFGDEGKGRIVDYLARGAAMVVRFQGGSNAGHTVVNEFGTFKLHGIPSGIFFPDTRNVIGSGCVVNPETLEEEIEDLEARGVSTNNLWISNRAHMLMPYHREADGLEEEMRSGDQKIGTTGQGIGPAYSDKTAREGLRMGDLLNSSWLEVRLESAVARANRYRQSMGAAPVDADHMMAVCDRARTALADRIVDTVPMMKEVLDADGHILLEGQLGVMRDLDWGIYPFVTSSNPTSAFAAAGAGLPIQAIRRVVGVAKAYNTAVGTGPMPAELHDKDGARLREIGHEYGATTGRPRRCGWLDLVGLRYAAWINGITELCMTKLDVLDGFKSVRVCTGYRMPDGRVERDSVPDAADLAGITPIMESFPGWEEDTTGCRSFDELPRNARAYVTWIADQVGIPIPYIGVGPARDQMVVNPGD